MASKLSEAPQTEDLKRLGKLESENCIKLQSGAQYENEKEK